MSLLEVDDAQQIAFWGGSHWAHLLDSGWLWWLLLLVRISMHVFGSNCISLSFQILLAYSRTFRLQAQGHVHDAMIDAALGYHLLLLQQPESDEHA